MSETPSNSSSITTFLLFEFKGTDKKWWAFREMGISYEWKQIPGLKFAKKLGTGGGSGFSIIPNFSVYAWLIAWESEAHAADFFDNNDQFNNWVNQANNHSKLYMTTITSHGTWHQQQPFIKTPTTDNESPVGVITRARVKWKYLPHFWRQVPSVNKKVLQAEGRLFTLGIGELPFLELATFSLWKNEAAVKKFAYGNPQHQKAIQSTRRLNWYSEELFARFSLYKVEGSWPGINVDSK